MHISAETDLFEVSELGHPWPTTEKRYGKQWAYCGSWYQKDNPILALINTFKKFL
jgi:hypothetical protein